MHRKRLAKNGSPFTVKAERHGLSKLPEYRVWAGMHKRCSNPNDRSYKDYGARGIKVDTRWRLFSVFLDDMGRRPSGRHSIDRIDPDSDYSPTNCRWILIEQQMFNRRVRSHTSKFNGVIKQADCERWRASITYQYNRIYIGLFESEVEAAWMRDQYALELHGDIANLNLDYR